MARTSIEIADAPEAVWSVLTDADASGISVVDSTVVVEYLAAAADVDVEGSPVVEIGGAEEMTYQRLLEEYARAAGARRATVLIPVPASPLRSRTGRRVAQFRPGKCPGDAQAAREPRHTTVVRDRTAEVFAFRPMKLRLAIEAAVAEKS